MFRGSRARAATTRLTGRCEVGGARLPTWRLQGVAASDLPLACEDPELCSEPRPPPGLDTDYDGRNQKGDSFKYFCDSNTKGGSR